MYDQDLENGAEQKKFEFPLNNDTSHFLLVDNGVANVFDGEMVDTFEENLLDTLRVRKCEQECALCNI
jgi:hypothetical protein